MRAQHIRANPRLLKLFKDCLRDMMTLMHHIIGATKLLVAMRDAGHATDTLHESSKSASMLDHDDKGCDHASSSTTPSDHG